MAAPANLPGEWFANWSFEEMVDYCLSDVDHDYLGLWHITALLRHAGVSSVDDRRTLGMALVRELVLRRDLAPGDLAEGGGFDPWPISAEDALVRVAHEWAEMTDDPNISDICWFDRRPS